MGEGPGIVIAVAWVQSLVREHPHAKKKKVCLCAPRSGKGTFLSSNSQILEDIGTLFSMSLGDFSRTNLNSGS